MTLRLPLFGILPQRSPIEALAEHYDLIYEGSSLIEDSLTHYIEGGTSRNFLSIQHEVDEIENQADKVDRSIRNHLPRGLFLAVDRTLFLSYVSRQDTILDAAQESLDWLSMRPVPIPAQFQDNLAHMVRETNKTVTLLGPALRMFIDFISGETCDRLEVKNACREVRNQHRHVRGLSHQVTSDVYNTDMDFKDIYQLIHFVERLFHMSHSTEGCANTIRAMIAK